MKPVKTPYTNQVFKLKGGTEENDLPVFRLKEPDNTVTLCSTWEPTDEERKLIAEGKNILLWVWGTGHPPVALGVEGVEGE